MPVYGAFATFTINDHDGRNSPKIISDINMSFEFFLLAIGSFPLRKDGGVCMLNRLFVFEGVVGGVY